MNIFAEQSNNIVPMLCRFRDLREAGIAQSWPQLKRLVDGQGFPAGFQLSPNIRAWKVSDVMRWLESRPTERKPAPKRRKVETIANQVEL
jgi:predicted DNA-binding transcriptional regulator AlpA